MFTHSIDPVAFSIGPISVYWYGLVYAVGFLFVAWYAEKKNLIPEDLTDSYMVWTVLGMLLGSRIFTFLFWDTATLFTAPLELFKIWNGGMSFHGGFLGFTISTILFARKNDLDWGILADELVITASVLLGLGRIANFINAELVGTISLVPWCVVFPGDDFCRHPYQIYAALKNFAVAGILYGISKYRYDKLELFGWFLILYNGFRFIVDTWRAEPSVLLSLSMGQILSFCFVIIGIFILYKPNYVYERFANN